MSLEPVLRRGVPAEHLAEALVVQGQVEDDALEPLAEGVLPLVLGVVLRLLADVPVLAEQVADGLEVAGADLLRDARAEDLVELADELAQALVLLLRGDAGAAPAVVHLLARVHGDVPLRPSRHAERLEVDPPAEVDALLPAHAEAREPQQVGDEDVVGGQLGVVERDHLRDP